MHQASKQQTPSPPSPEPAYLLRVERENGGRQWVILDPPNKPFTNKGWSKKRITLEWNCNTDHRPLYDGGRIVKTNELTEISKSIMTHRVTKAARHKFNQTQKDNIAASEYRRGTACRVSRLKMAHNNRSAILIGAGPSLGEEDLQTLSDFRYRYKLISGSRTLKLLYEWSIIPDYVICIDPGDIQHHFPVYNVFDLEKFSLVASAFVHPETLNQACYRLYFCGANPRVDGEVIEDSDQLPTGGSVSCTALSLAMLMGCKPIALLGYDHAWGEGGKVYPDGGLDEHARATVTLEGKILLSGYDDEREAVRNWCSLRGVNGEPVCTSNDYAVYARWFKRFAKELDTPGWVTDCSKGADLGFEHLSFSEWVSKTSS
jgi:hypothetical protein